MKILILGNGFDLEHELPTKYGDFIKFIIVLGFLPKLKKDDLICDEDFNELNNYVKEYFQKDEIFDSQRHSKITKELVKLISGNIWIEYFVGKFKLNQREDNNNKGWIDFESEISEIIQSLDYLSRFEDIKLKSYHGTNRKIYESELYNNEFDSKSMEFLEFVSNGENGYKNKSFDFQGKDAKKIIGILITDLNNLIRCLEIYLEECVGKIKIEYKAPDIIEIGRIDKLISFNYTKTYQKVYGRANEIIEYDYIHGKLDVRKDMKENNMVLGIDEYLDETKKDKNLEFIQFKKYFQRIYKKTGCKYKAWITGINDSAIKEIFIFGHSLDVTDKDILKELILHKSSRTTIFYYNKADYATKISNLVKIIGQDVLIASVYGSTPTIKFEQQQQRIEK